jgi:hypothetical protein
MVEEMAKCAMQSQRQPQVKEKSLQQTIREFERNNKPPVNQKQKSQAARLEK